MSRSTLQPRQIVRVALVLTLLLAACGAAEGDGDSRRATGDSAMDAGAGGEGSPTTLDGPRRGTAWVIFGTDTVVAEVARTPEERSRGLMYREEVPDGTGMLFVFDRSETRSFWMQNTYVPLDIAFMDQSFRIVDIQQMEPETEELYESAVPAILALEVRKGWLAEHGVEVGDVAQIVFGG